MKPNSWRTSVWGILSIIASALQLVLHYHSTGQVDPAALTGLTGGAGLFAAADHQNLPK